MEQEHSKRLSVAQLIDRAVTDFLDGKGAWDRRQAINREAAMAHAGGGENLALVRPHLRTEGPRPAESALNQAEQPNAQEPEAWQRDGERIRAELGHDPLAHWLAFDRLAVENPAAFEQYKAMENSGELGSDHPFSHPAGMAVATDALGGPPMSGPTGFALAHAEVRFSDLHDNSGDYEDRQWRPWSKLDRAEREQLARDYAADPTHTDRPFEVQVAHFNMMEAGKAHFETLDKAQQEQIKDDFFTRGFRDRNPFRDAIYLDIAKSDLAIDQMPIGAIEAGKDAGLPGFQLADFDRLRARSTEGATLGADRVMAEERRNSNERSEGGLPDLSQGLSQAVTQYLAVRRAGSEYAWRSWSKMDYGERQEIARDYAADPDGKKRTYEAPVAHFNMMEAGKAHFDTLDKSQQDEIKRDFFSQTHGAQDQNPYQQAVYLDIARSDIPREKMPIGARLAGEDAGLPGFEPDYEAEQKRYDEYANSLLAMHADEQALTNGQTLQFDDKSLGYQAAQCALGKEIAARGLGSGHDLDQEHHGEKWSYQGSRLVDGELQHSFKHSNHPRGGSVEFTVQGVPMEELGEPEQLLNVPALAWRNLDDDVADALMDRHLDQPDKFPHPFEAQIRGTIAAAAAIQARHSLVDDIRTSGREREPTPQAQEQEAGAALGR